MQNNRPNNNGLDVKSFVFYASFYEAARKIKDKKVQLDVLCRIIEYGLYGRPLDVSDIDQDGSLSKAVAAIKDDMDARKVERARIGNQNARKYYPNK